MKLALHGGTPIRKEIFPSSNTIGAEEKEAVCRVIDSGVLSKFLGSWHENYYGGAEVQALEKEWASYFGVKHAISVNSNTSGLFCAVGAIGIEPGDEVIVSPYSMSASAVAPIIFNAIPVFADIEPEYYCLDLESIKKRVTPRTKAILVVDIFGQPYDRDSLNAFAKERGIRVIEDAAQAPGAKYKGAFAGSLGDVGIFSLNYHKHIQCGEGGIVVTNDDQIAEKVRLIRNHGEAVVEDKGEKDITNILGFNFRMTELEAAVARCQLRKLEKIIDETNRNVVYLNGRLSSIPCLIVPNVRPECLHSFYLHALKYDERKAGIPREKFVDAVCAELQPVRLLENEGVNVWGGYAKPLYLQPLYQQKIAYGSKSFPWSTFGSSVSYAKGICPVTEKMHESEVIVHEYFRPPFTKQDLDDVASAFQKVWECRGEF